jgi:N,N'-diacetyllegionaminate synthase
MRNFKGKHGSLLIAEIGGNHEGNFEYAKELCQLAIGTEADFVKFQIYTGETLVSTVENPTRVEHFKKFQLSREQHRYLAQMVVDAGKKYTSSVWSIDAMEWIDDFISIYKIGSGDLTAFPLLRSIAMKGKPIILSTGLSTEDEVLSTVAYIQSINPVYKDKDFLALLQCTSMYPISDSDANLNVMARLKQLTGLTIGYSDHTEGPKALYYAASLGAEVLEFHFTDSRENKTFRDHKVSLTPDEVNMLAGELLLIERVKGDAIKKPVEIEIQNEHHITFRRAVYPSREIKMGEVLTEENLTVLRPNHGIDAREFDALIGRTALIRLDKHQKLDWKYFK